MKKSLLKSLALFFLPCLFTPAFYSCKHGSDSLEKETEAESTFDLTKWTGSQDYKSPVSLPELSNQSENLKAAWWQESAFYHIWIKSFRDSDTGDCSQNCGDFKGIEDSLAYIQDDLGCDAIWLSPFWDCYYKGSSNEASAQINMHGYDVTDFYTVNKYFGTGDGTAESAEAELESLIKACHDRGMKIIFDFVPNHTASTNQWFLDSAAAKKGKRDWYLWSDTPTGWKNTWGASAWHAKNGSYYYAMFADTQPDLNYRNYEVREEMKHVVRYWLNKGFDGLRIDAARYLVETASSQEDCDETHAWFQELREVIDEYQSPKFMVSEAWIENNRSKLNGYFGSLEKPEFNMVLDFDQGWTCIDDVKYSNDSYVSRRLFTPPESTCSYGTFLGNHDEYHSRLGDYFGEGTTGPAVLASALSLLRATVPFIYYGNEIGQKSESQSGDFRLRQSFKWAVAEAQKADEDSLLNVNRALLSLRKADDYKALFAAGKMTALKCDMVESGSQKAWKGALAYTIADESSSLLIVANLTGYSQSSLWFSGLSLEDSSYSLLVGNKDSDCSISTESYGSVTDLLFHDMSPYEIRVYDLQKANAHCLLDIWD